MIANTTFNKLLHLSRSGYLLQSIHNGQRNYPYEVSVIKYYAYIFKICISDKLGKCKFDPNETIIMHDLT